MTTIPQSSGNFTYSSPKNPCPVCGRTKDGDCRLDSKSLCHCRTYAKETLTRGEVVRGKDGQQWAYLGGSDGGRWALFKPHEERRKDDWEPNLTSFAKRSAPPTHPTPKPAAAPERPTTTPPPAKKPRPKGQQDFIYRDADGQPVVLVRREDDGQGNKKIRQFRYENGKWVSGLNDQVTGVSKRVRLYRIADAKKLSEKTGIPIFMVEGEKCVERLMGLGIPATTSIGGAGKWSGYGGLNYLQDLQGCRIVLSPDADRPGLDHMLEIERSLHNAGIEIVGWLLAPPDAPWENLPKSGGLDVVDWLESGATVDQIWAAIRRDPPQQDGEPESGVQDAETLAEVEELSRLDQGSGLSLLPESLEAPLKRLAGWLNLPPEAYYLSLLCASASQVSNRTRLELDRGTDYNVPPILWGGIVGETGSRKTPIINAITSPLDAIQADLEQLYRARLEAYQAELREYEKSKREARGDFPVEPKPTDLYVSDFTLEALCQVLGRQPERGLLVGLDELTTFFKSMDAYRNGRGSDRARWLEFYNARALKVDRKTTGRVYVPQTSISVIGGIQPSVIRGLWEQDKTGEDGLWARFAWVRIPITPSPGIQEGATYDLSELLKSLYRNLSRLPDKTYRLDRQGIRVWNEWHHEIDRQIIAEPSDILRASLPKTKDRAARIALVLHLIEAAVEGNRDPDTVIPAETLTKAICFARWLQGQTRLLYGELGVVDNPEAARILRFVNRFKGCGSVKAKQVVQWWSPKSDRPKASEARRFMEKIVRLGWAIPKGDPTHADYSITILSQPANHDPKSLDNQGIEPVGTSSQPMPTQPTAVIPKGEHATRTGADLTTNPASSGWQSWQKLAGDANHSKASNDKHPGTTVGKLAHLGMEQKKANNEAYGDPIDDWDPNSPKVVEPETPPLPRPPVDDDTPITVEDWRALLAAYPEAGMSWETVQQFIVSTMGIPIEEFSPVRITQGQYRRIMNGIEERRRVIENRETETSPFSRQSMDDADSTPQEYNVAANGQRVRFLDRDPVRPDLRGRTAQLEREALRSVVVWVDGIRQRVPKDWLVNGSSDSNISQNGSPLPRTEEGAATGISTAGDTGAKASTGRSDKPQSATNGSLTTSSTGMSKTQQSQKQAEDDPVIDGAWNGLLDACCRAGVSHLHLREVLSEATGIPKRDVGTVPLTRSQYQRAIDYLANYRGEEGDR